MKQFVQCAIALALSLALFANAQTPSTKTKSVTKKKSISATVTQSDIQALRQMMEQQQQQMQQMRQEMQQKDAILQQTQQQLQALQRQANEAQSKAGAAESASNDAATKVTSLHSDMADVRTSMADVRTTLTNNAVNTQDEQKKFGELAGLVGRFRMSGDIRVRYENFFQEQLAQRNRFRVRMRLGVDGKLTEDFVGGFAIATGTSNDPISTNEDLSNFFTRKTVTVDRAYVSYQPKAYKWMKLTGGKFARNWASTELTFDNDINPEGFTESFNVDVNKPALKNLNFTGIQLYVSESKNGSDTYAAGGQLGAKLALGNRVTVNPYFTVLNWRNADSIATALGNKSLGGNSLTNASTTLPNGNKVFNSRFLYTNYLVDAQVKTWSDKFPVRLLLEYQDNLNAASDQGQAYSGDISIGRTRQKHDYQLGYAFYHIEQDAVISAFVGSDFRTPTNLVQNKIYFNWMPQANTTFGYTAFIGRTLDSNLQNALLAPGATPGQRESYLKRMQFDVVYKF